MQDAYDVLSDEKKRAQYDQFGFAGPQAGPGGAGGFHWGGGFPGNGNVELDPEQAQEIFSQFFGGGMGGDGVNLNDILGGRAGTKRGGRGRSRRETPPPTVAVTIPFETATQGGSVTLRVGEKTIELKIPPGTEDGKVMRLAGQGPGGADLHLRIRVESNPHFRREGNDVILTVPITLAEAVLGAKIDVPTLSGKKLSVKIPPGTSTGNRLRLRGFGVDGGDQYLRVSGGGAAEFRRAEPRTHRGVCASQSPAAAHRSAVGMSGPRDTPMTSLRFRKEEHLTRPADFRKVFERRCSVSDARLIVYGLPNARDYCRLGLSVSRKVGPAVHRNRLRRLYREAFRLSRAEMPVGLDLVLIPRSPAEPTLAQLRQSLPVLVHSLARRLARKEKA